MKTCKNRTEEYISTSETLKKVFQAKTGFVPYEEFYDAEYVVYLEELVCSFFKMLGEIAKKETNQ